MVATFVNGYTYDDVVLSPKYSEVYSRAGVDVSVVLPKKIKLQIPLVSANMKSVTDIMMAYEMARLGGLGLLHRFDTHEKLLDNFKRANIQSDVFPGVVGGSVGIGDDDYKLANDLYNLGCKVLCVDVAHGHHSRVGKFVSGISKSCPDALIIAGNVATPEGAQFLWEAGADVVKCGIGNGCFAAGTRILMSNGFYKNIKDVQPGDRVINKDGLPKTVLKSFSTGIKKVSKVRSSIFYKETSVTPDHKYFVGDLNAGDGEKLKWQEIGKANDVALLMPKNISFELPEDFCIDFHDSDGKVEFSLTPSYEVGYVLGAFLSASNNSKECGSLKSVEWSWQHIRLNPGHNLENCLLTITGKNLFSLKANIEKPHCYTSVNIDNIQLTEFLLTLEKGLPPNLLVKNNEYLEGIIQGLIDFGFVTSVCLFDYNRNIYLSNSWSLKELFSIASYMLSGNFKHFGGSGRAGDMFEGVYQNSEILSFENTNQGLEVFDLEIDCDTHSFIADNSIVHNSLCTTRIETGNGYPQLSALQNIREHDFYSHNKPNTDPPMIIADGGIRRAGDCVKGLCFSDMIMLGNLLAGTDEAPGEIVSIDGSMYKQYAGSSTHKQNHVEGVVGLVPYKGPVEKIIIKLIEGIKSGCSYQGVNKVQDLQNNPSFVVISNAGLIESHPHDVKL